jgi:hypothetical protein
MLARIIGAGTVTVAPSVNQVGPAGSTAEMIFPNREWPAIALSASSVSGVPLVADWASAVRTNPPTRVAARLPQKPGPVKVDGNAAGGDRIVVKVLQPDGTLKEQSFPSAPRH